MHESGGVEAGCESFGVVEVRGELWSYRQLPGSQVSINQPELSESATSAMSRGDAISPIYYL